MIQASPDIQTLPDFEIWMLLDRTGFAISRLRELELSQFDLSIEQSNILGLLKIQNNSTTIREIEKMTMYQRHSVSLLISRMIKKGLVDKTRNSDEKRYKITISPKGQSSLKEMTTDSLKATF